MGKVEVLERKVDPQGRVTLPAKWRKEKLKKGRKILILKHPGYIKIVSKKREKLTEFFDSVEVKLRSNLKNYQKVKKELIESGE